MPLRDESKYNIVVKGEPAEVTEIRKKILSSFEGLEFVDEGHKYFLNGQELTSVSSVVSEFEEQFDAEAKAVAYAEKNGETPEYWLDQWRFTNLKATISGTQVHAYGESLAWLHMGHPENITEDNKYKYIADKGWLIPTRPKECAALKFFKDFPKDMYIVLPETKIYNIGDRFKYAGTFDLLAYYDHPTDKSKSGLVVLDWKGLDVNTLIFTKKGWKTMGTIEVGDIVYDKDGKETKVLHTSEVHNRKCYKIRFDNNTEVICDNEHRWLVNFARRNGKKKYVEKVMTADELYELSKGKRYEYKIPKVEVAKALNGDEIDLPIDPYVFGVWLGDGHTWDGKITNMYDDIFKEIERRGYTIGNDVSGGFGKAKTRTIFGLRTLLRKNNLLGDKHVPDVYLRSSYSQKLEVLQGLMDTDGYYHPTRKRYVLSTTREKQVDFSVKLLSSMGIKTSVIKYIKKLNGKRIQAYDVSFKTKVYPFKIRKIDVDIKDSVFCNFYNIRKIEPIESVPTRCIEVDSETHTYLFGRDFIVTHNTNRELNKQYSREHGKMMIWPFSELYEEPYSAYVCQLNLYTMALKKIGLKVVGRRVIWLKDDESYEIVSVPDVSKQFRLLDKKI